MQMMHRYVFELHVELQLTALDLDSLCLRFPLTGSVFVTVRVELVSFSAVKTFHVRPASHSPSTAKRRTTDRAAIITAKLENGDPDATARLSASAH